MSHKSNDEIVENIQTGLEEMKEKVIAYCDFLELLSKEHQEQLLKLREVLDKI